MKEEFNEEIENLDEEKDIEINLKQKELSKKKKKKTGRIIANILVSLMFLIVMAEAAIGIINMQRINDEKEPLWYISKKDNNTKNKKETIYNLGLYKIVKTDTSKKSKISLKPFFVGD